MKVVLQKAKKHKKLLLILVVALLFFALVSFSKPIQIIDKYNSLMRSSNQTYRTRSLSSINQIVVHHSASIGQFAEDYARYHVRSKGWPGIGYTFVLEINGDIIQANPLTNVSYGVSGHNTRSINICLSGDFTKQEPSSLQLKSLKKLITHLRKELPQQLPVKGHKDYGQTSCPGPALYKHLNKFNLAA
jgi:hypothetical protein